MRCRPFRVFRVVGLAFSFLCWRLHSSCPKLSKQRHTRPQRPPCSPAVDGAGAAGCWSCMAQASISVIHGRRCHAVPHRRPAWEVQSCTNTPAHMSSRGMCSLAFLGSTVIRCAWVPPAAQASRGAPGGRPQPPDALCGAGRAGLNPECILPPAAQARSGSTRWASPTT